MAKGIFGAQRKEWANLDIVLGLTQDLLPVVSNVNSEVAPYSKLKTVGKVPSCYNPDRQVVGIAKWTQHEATESDLEKWSNEPDYGICIQTRNVRAIDIDIEDSQAANAIRAFVSSTLEQVLPARYRENSGKILLAFHMDGQHAKRTIKTEHGIIEFLMNGQQFIAAGTHPSGARYEWDWQGCDDFPEITQDQFERLFDGLVKAFAIEEPTKGHLRQQGETRQVEDSTAEFLEENGLVLGYGPENQLFIECPFKDEHTTESGETATAYLPAGVRGYKQGHFKCLHAHCEGRDDVDFLDALGVRVAGFDVIEPTKEEMDTELPPFKRNQKTGEVLATIGNVIKAAESPYVCGYAIRYDSFRDEIMLFHHKDNVCQELKDESFTAMRERLEEGFYFKPVAADKMRDAARLVAQRNTIDSAQEWLEAQKWDGIKRVETFLPAYLGTEDTPYTRAVSRYIWTALAGRVVEPGVKADMVPILRGEQGAYKSTAIAALAPAPELFCEISLTERDDDLARLMRGCVVAEIAELKGLRSRELESIKAFVTRTHESWVPKYKEFSVKYPRRLVFFGTTNDSEFLIDSTGNRRWLPFEVGKIDTKAIKRDRDALWAEGRELFNKAGVVHTEAEKLAETEHEDFMVVDDAWSLAITAWLETGEGEGFTNLSDDTLPRDREYLTTGMVLSEALNIPLRKQDKRHAIRVSDILKRLGYQKIRIRDQGHRPNVWVKK